MPKTRLLSHTVVMDTVTPVATTIMATTTDMPMKYRRGQTLHQATSFHNHPRSLRIHNRLLLFQKARQRGLESHSELEDSLGSTKVVLRQMAITMDTVMTMVMATVTAMIMVTAILINIKGKHLEGTYTPLHLALSQLVTQEEKFTCMKSA